MKCLHSPIEMIVHFDKEGKITPIRFRYSADTGERYVVNVEHIHKTSENKYAGYWFLQFDCSSIINGTVRKYQLRYFSDTSTWQLFKI